MARNDAKPLPSPLNSSSPHSAFRPRIPRSSGAPVLKRGAKKPTARQDREAPAKTAPNDLLEGAAPPDPGAWPDFAPGKK